MREVSVVPCAARNLSVTVGLLTRPTRDGPPWSGGCIRVDDSSIELTPPEN